MAKTNRGYTIDAYGNKIEVDGEPIAVDESRLTVSIAGRPVQIPLKVVRKLSIRGKEMTVEQWKKQRGK